MCWCAIKKLLTHSQSYFQTLSLSCLLAIQNLQAESGYVMKFLKNYLKLTATVLTTAVFPCVVVLSPCPPSHWLSQLPRFCFVLAWLCILHTVAVVIPVQQCESRLLNSCHMLVAPSASADSQQWYPECRLQWVCVWMCLFGSALHCWSHRTGWFMASGSVETGLHLQVCCTCDRYFAQYLSDCVLWILFPTDCSAHQLVFLHTGY